MAIWLFEHSGVFGLALAVLEVEANLIGATAHAPTAPCVATMTQSWAQRDPVVEVSGPADASVRTTKVVEPEPWPSVKMKGCAASCGPHPNAFASSALVTFGEVHLLFNSEASYAGLDPSAIDEIGPRCDRDLGSG